MPLPHDGLACARRRRRERAEAREESGGQGWALARRSSPSEHEASQTTSRSKEGRNREMLDSLWHQRRTSTEQASQADKGCVRRGAHGHPEQPKAFGDRLRNRNTPDAWTPATRRRPLERGLDPSVAYQPDTICSKASSRLSTFRPDDPSSPPPRCEYTTKVAPPSKQRRPAQLPLVPFRRKP
jgi:hypothetical protein